MSTAAHRRPGPLAGVRPLVGLALRRSRWFYASWVLGLSALPPLTAAAYGTVVDPATAPPC